MVVLALARPHNLAAGAAARDTRGCGCAALFSRNQRRSSALPQPSLLSAGPGSGRRHFPEEFAQPADLGIARFDKRSAAEVEQAFPAMVRAGSLLRLEAEDAAAAVPTGVELFSMDLGPTTGRRKRPGVASPIYEPHWLDAPRRG